MSEKVSIGGKVPVEVNERLDELAERIGWTKSDLVAHCVQFGLREGEKFADRMEGPVLGPVLRFVFSMDVDDPNDQKAFEQVAEHVERRKASNQKLKKGAKA